MEFWQTTAPFSSAAPRRPSSGSRARRSTLTLRLASRGFSALRSGHDPDLLGECEKNLTAPNQDAYRTLAKPV